MTVPHCVRRIQFEMKEQMETSEKREHVKEQEVEGSVHGEQSERFLMCGRKREGHWPSHLCICTVTLTFPRLILSRCANLNLWQGY